MSSREYRGQGVKFPAPSIPNVARGAGTPYSRKYVEVPAAILRGQILPTAANAAAAAVRVQRQRGLISKQQTREVYLQLLRQGIKSGIKTYTTTGGVSFSDILRDLLFPLEQAFPGIIEQILGIR